MLKQRASSPPLLRQVRYLRPEGAIATDILPTRERKPMHIQSVLLGLDSNLLPLATSTVQIAEQIRVRLMGAHKRRAGEENVAALFSGKAPDGGKQLGHAHLYILPIGNSQGRIDRVFLISPLRVFEPDELDAIRGVRSLYQADGRPEVRCAVIWQGGLEDSERKRCSTVESATPFVPPRHWRKGRDHAEFIAAEVRRECRNHHVAFEPSSIELLDRMPGLFDTFEYRRNRKDDPVRPGYALRLVFPGPIAAPFAIGYGAHFGLGQFRAPE
jgi:CRISPR-associated protein Csb2